jgi:branched-chain amino acid transport system ATP-binding protein
MLEIASLSVNFGAVSAFEDVSLSVGEREIVALVGHNGAGKTTLMRAVSGLQQARTGRIMLDGADVTGEAPHMMARKALAYVRQGRNVFSEMSVADNLDLAAKAANRPGLPRDAILDLFPILAEKRQQRAGSLSGGQQQMLALGIALARGPRLIMLDEPSTGLAPILVQVVFDTVKRLHSEFGTSFLIVDQNVEQLLALASRAYVLKAGRLVYDGPSAALGGPALWAYF